MVGCSLRQLDPSLQPDQGPASRPMSGVPLSRRWPEWRHVTRHGWHGERWHWRRSDCRRSSMRHPVHRETQVKQNLKWNPEICRSPRTIVLTVRQKWNEKVSFCWYRDSFINTNIMELLLRTNFDIPKPPGGVFDREYSHFFTYQIFYWACQLSREKSLFCPVLTSRLWIRPLPDWIISIHQISDMNWPFQNRIENLQFYASWIDSISIFMNIKSDKSQ